MNRAPDHIPNQELAMMANRELPPARLEVVNRHLEGCMECRNRLESFEAALGEYFEAYREQLDPRLPDRSAAGARLTQRIADVSARRPWIHPIPAALAAGAIAAGLAGIAFLYEFGEEANRFAPDSALTPGLTRPIAAAELCATGMDEPAPSVSRAVAMEVFRRHGIANPVAGAYELDYLIPPELGGARDDRNLWPQPYRAEPWNAHAKDALEDHLRRLVCEGKLDLRVAQEEIANDWTVAYRKYFATDQPLLSHATFLKDAPWQ